MKKGFLFTASMLFCIALFAQSDSTAQEPSGKIVYDYVLNLNGIPIPREATLYFKTSASLFVHSKGQGFVTIDINGNIGDETATVKSGDTGGKVMIDGYMQDAEGNAYYTDFKRQKLNYREILIIRPYLSEEPRIPHINWSVRKEFKKIGGFACQKAEGAFRGRNYTAWFTSEIPLSIGPWKLAGLPGAVLEAYDDSGEVKFNFKSFKTNLPAKEYALIQAPVSGERVPFDEMKTALRKEQEKLFQRMMASNERDPNSTVELKEMNKIEKSYEY